MKDPAQAAESEPGKRRPPSRSDPALPDLIRRHLRFGWWSLLIFLSLGLVLESLHGFKVGWYVDVSSSTRRLMWTLAHAHGTMLGLVHVAFALTAPLPAEWDARSRNLASTCLVGASVLLPAGFFLGGLFTHGGDPGLGILLVPAGAALLIIAVLLTALGVRRAG